MEDAISRLFLAAKVEDLSAIESLLKQDDIDINFQDSDGRTPLSYAAENGNWWAVYELLKKNDILADSKDKDGRTPLSYAAEKGRLSVLTKLLKRNDVDPNSMDNNGRTPLSFAVEGGHDSIMAELFERDDIITDPKDKNGRTPLSYAAEKGRQSAMAELLKRGDMDINSQDDGGRTPLSYATAKGHTSSVTELLKQPEIAADSKDHVGRTPLSYAAKNGHLSIVTKLLSRTDVFADSKDEDGRTPLSYAAENGDDPIVTFLLKRASVAAHSVDKDGRTPLMFATMMGHELIVRSLLKKGNHGAADSKDIDGRTPLSYAAEMGHWGIVYVLTKLRYVVRDSKDKIGRTPLSYAAEKGHTFIEYWLSEWKTVDINFRDKNGWTLLSEWKHEPTLLELLDRNDVIADSKDKDGRTFLSYAVEAGRDSVVKSLLRRKDVNADSRDKNGRTPLSYAAERGYLGVVLDLLMRSNVVRDSMDEHGRTPLSYAAENGKELILLELLKSRGWNLLKWNNNAAGREDKDGRTPLSYAAEKGHGSIVTILLGRSVVADFSDKNGRTPLSYAAEKGHESIVEDLLKRAEVNVNSKDKDGQSPLSYATKSGHRSIIVKLSSQQVEDKGGLKNRHWWIVRPFHRIVGKLSHQNHVTNLEENKVDEVSDSQSNDVDGQVIVLGAVNAMKHVNKHRSDISQLLAQYSIHSSDYIIQTGFNSQLFFDEVGFLEEITVMSAIMPNPGDFSNLLDELGKILSPFSGVFCTKEDAYPTPIFKEDGERWDIDSFTLASTKWGPIFSQAAISSNIVSQQLLNPQDASSQPLSDGDTSKRVSGQKSDGISRKGGSGQAQSQNGKGKARDKDEDGAEQGGSNQGHGNVDNDPHSQDDELPKVYFDTFAGIQGPEPTLSNHLSHSFKIAGIISIPKTKMKAQTLHVEFGQLTFQGQSHLKEAKYSQAYACVAIDARHPITVIQVNHPHKTAASMKQETVTDTEETGWNIGGNLSGGAIQTLNPLSKSKILLDTVQGVLAPLVTKKGTAAIAKTRILSRITNFQDQGVVWWGFEVDDPNFHQLGIELLESNLPSADFKYLGKAPLNLPEHIDIEVAAYWSMPQTARWSWLSSQESVQCHGRTQRLNVVG